jgi:hypothetical protein
MVHHSDEKFYKCNYCKDHPGFTYSQGLRTHLFKNHKNVYSDFGQNKICEVCYKSFETENELFLHERVHEKLKCHVSITK